MGSQTSKAKFDVQNTDDGIQNEAIAKINAKAKKSANADADVDSYSK